MLPWRNEQWVYRNGDESPPRLKPAVMAILLDRDGVINRDLGRSVRSWEEFEFLPGVLPALQLMATMSVPVVVVTNQADVGRGRVSADVVENINRRMVDTVHAAGGRIDEVLMCPHAPEAACRCRKPQPGLLIAAANRYGFELRRTVVVGDAHRDVQAAQAVQAIPILVRSGRALPHGLEERLRVERVRVLADLVTVVEALLTGALSQPAEGEKQGSL